MAESGWKTPTWATFILWKTCQIQLELDSTLMYPYLCCNYPKADPPILAISGKSSHSSLPCTFYAVVAGETEVQERAERLNDLWRCQRMPDDVCMCQPTSRDISIYQQKSGGVMHHRHLYHLWQFDNRLHNATCSTSCRPTTSLTCSVCCS